MSVLPRSPLHASWINRNFELNHAALAVIHFGTASHTADNIHDALIVILKDYDLSMTDIPATTDHGSNIVAALRNNIRVDCLCHRQLYQAVTYTCSRYNGIPVAQVQRRVDIRDQSRSTFGFELCLFVSSLTAHPFGQHSWVYESRESVAYWAERAGHSLQPCTDALSARGFDLDVNRFSSQIQQLVPLPGLICKNARGSGRHLTIQPLFSCPWYTVKPADATCIMNAAIQDCAPDREGRHPAAYPV